MSHRIGDMAFCVRGDRPRRVTVVQLIDGGDLLYVAGGHNGYGEYIVRPDELHGSLEDAQAFITARQASVGHPPPVVSPETVKAAYQPPVESQLSLFA